MPKKTYNKEENADFYFTMTKRLFDLEISLGKRVVMGYIYSILSSNKYFYALNNDIASKLKISPSAASNAISTLIEMQLVQKIEIPKQCRTLILGEALKNSGLGSEKMGGKQTKIKRQALKKSDHIVKEINKVINKDYSSNNKNEIQYSPRRIMNLIKAKIFDFDENYLSHIDENLLLELKDRYILQSTKRWDNDHQIFLPPLIYAISNGFIKDIKGTSNVREKIKQIFDLLIRQKTKYSNSIPSYFRVYNYWIDEIEKDERVFKMIKSIGNSDNWKEDF